MLPLACGRPTLRPGREERVSHEPEAGADLHS